MSNSYTGVRVFEVSYEKIEKLYQEKSIDVWDNRYNWHPNLYVVLKDINGSNGSALCRVKNNKLCLINNKDYSVSGIVAKNKEQRMAFDCLMDDEVRIVSLVGRAGSGKTLLSIAAALQKVQEKKYSRIIYTRPMSEVGKYKLGTLPGVANEKFEPYLQAFMCNAEYLMGNKAKIQDLIQQYKVEFIPIQLFRGASFHNSFLIVDEIQVLPKMDVLTIGTRVAHGSKIVLLGDLNQRDERIKKENTGLYECMNNVHMKESDITAAIELLKCERDVVPELFSKVFEGCDDF